MRYLPILLLLASCQGREVADTFMPDEFTAGVGSTSIGGLISHVDSRHEFDAYGEAESTYASLTWHLPSFGPDSSGMDRETQRNLSLALDRLVGEDVEDKVKVAAAITGVGLNLREGVELPPAWVGFAVLAAIIALIGAVVAKNRRRNRWR